MAKMKEVFKSMVPRLFIKAALVVATAVVAACGGSDGPPSSGPLTLAVQFAFVANGGAAVAVLKLNESDGQLSLVEQRTGLQSPTALAVSGDDTTLYVGDAGYGQARISQLAIDPTSGSLTSRSETRVVGGARQLATDSTGASLYAAGWRGGGVQRFRIDQATKALSPLVDLAGEADITPVIAIDPLNRFVYVQWAVSGPHGVNPHLDAYTPLPDGGLALLSKRTAAIPDCLTMHPSGRFAYGHESGSGAILAFAVGAVGALTPVQTLGSVGRWSCSALVGPDGRFFYVAGLSSLDTYRVDSTAGTLIPVASTPLPVAAMSWGLASTRDGAFLLVLMIDGRVSSYRIDATSGTTTLAGSTLALGPASPGLGGAIAVARLRSP